MATAERRLGYSRSGSAMRKVSAESGVEAGIDGAKLLKAAEHQAGEDDEHECEGHLSSHQQMTGAVAAAACGVAATALVK